MNPLNNRWVALFVVVGFLLVVAELVGTGEHGGVLSRTARSMASDDGPSAQAMEAPPPTEVISEQPTVIDEVPEEDLPQIVAEDDVDDTGDLSVVDDFPGPEITSDESFEDGSGEE